MADAGVIVFHGTPEIESSFVNITEFHGYHITPVKERIIFQVNRLIPVYSMFNLYIVGFSIHDLVIKNRIKARVKGFGIGLGKVADIVAKARGSVVRPIGSPCWHRY